MKILFLDFDDIANPLLGAGQARATAEVGSRLVKLGNTVISLCSKYPGYKDRVENGIKYIHIGMGTNNIRLNNFIYICTVPFVLLRIQADIIVECFTAPMSTLCAPLFTKIPVVALPTSFDADRFAKQYYVPVHWIERFCLRFYTYFMPYTPAYEAKMRMYNPKIISKLIPEGVGKEFFAIKAKKPAYILFLGRIEINQKGIDLLLQAFAKIAHTSPYKLVIAGKGPDEAKMHELIKKYALTSYVSFVGPAYGPSKYELLSKAVYVVMPSRNEGFSLFSLEALAAGLPIVAFDIDGFSWTSNQPVIKVPPFDVNALSNAMLKATKQRYISPMRKRARRSVKQFTWDAVAKQFFSFFTEILHINSLRTHKGDIV